MAKKRKHYEKNFTDPVKRFLEENKRKPHFIVSSGNNLIIEQENERIKRDSNVIARIKREQSRKQKKKILKHNKKVRKYGRFIRR